MFLCFCTRRSSLQQRKAHDVNGSQRREQHGPFRPRYKCNALALAVPVLIHSSIHPLYKKSFVKSLRSVLLAYFPSIVSWRNDLGRSLFLILYYLTFITTTTKTFS